MPTFKTFIKLIWYRRDRLPYSAAVWQQIFSSSFEMKFPFWQNNHFGNTSCLLLRPSSSLFGTGETDCNIQLPCGNKIFHQASRWNFHFDKIIILATHHIMPTFETFIKPIWDRRDWLQYSAALWQQNFSSSLEMKFPFWKNNHFGNISSPLLRPSSRHFGVTGARLQSSACLW